MPTSCSSKTANFGPLHPHTPSSPISMNYRWSSKRVRACRQQSRTHSSGATTLNLMSAGPTFSGAVQAAGGSGALNLLSREPYAVDSEGEVIGAMATHAAGVMMTVNWRKEFESALASRDLMGQAKGVLMNQFSIDAVRAFEMLVQQSQNTNTPVRIIAQQIVDIYTGGSTPTDT